MKKRPLSALPLVRAPSRLCTPDRIRTGATALRERPGVTGRRWKSMKVQVRGRIHG
jgi:hypothetical protein